MADSSAIAAEVLNAIPVVQSYAQEAREAQRFDAATESAFDTAVQPHAGALAAGRLHHHRHLRRAAVGPVPGHAGGDRRRRSAPGHLGADGGLRDHPGRLGGGAVRGLRRPAARRRRDRAADGTAGHALADRRRPPQPRALPAARGGSSVRAARRAPSTTRRGRSTPALDALRRSTCGPARRWRWSARAAPARARCSSCCCASTTRSRGRVRDRRRAGRATPRSTTLRQRIGIVPQDSVIFSANALENIRYGRPDASDDEVIAAAKAAFAHDFISALPEGYADLPRRARRAPVGRAAPAHQRSRARS